MCEVVSGDIESVERDICGKCEVSEESDGSLWVKRADERIHISMDMLDAIANGYGAPGVTFGENILTIRGKNRTVSYGLVSRDEERLCWLAEKSPELDHID